MAYPVCDTQGGGPNCKVENVFFNGRFKMVCKTCYPHVFQEYPSPWTRPNDAAPSDKKDPPVDESK